MRWALVVALLAAGCSRRVSERDDSLQDYLSKLAGAGESARRSAVERWKLDRDGWDRVTTDPYRDHYAAYAAQFDERTSALAAKLAKPGAITIRQHYAGDPKLTIAQARARWAQPVAASSQVAELDGVAIDAVFVHDGGRWRAIVGIDALVFQRTAAKDLACATRASGQVKGTCGDLAWFIADAALRDDGARLERACTQLTNLCPRNP